ncbi:hypothetical protein [Polaromonas sp.]|uniref:hypothetical protein n=1 Tax=Polaromonas sp. TaxID=1869339 RepID=UPI0037C9775A
MNGLVGSSSKPVLVAVRAEFVEAVFVFTVRGLPTSRATPGLFEALYKQALAKTPA